MRVLFAAIMAVALAGTANANEFFNSTSNVGATIQNVSVQSSTQVRFTVSSFLENLPNYETWNYAQCNENSTTSCAEEAADSRDEEVMMEVCGDYYSGSEDCWTGEQTGNEWFANWKSAEAIITAAGQDNRDKAIEKGFCAVNGSQDGCSACNYVNGQWEWNNWKAFAIETTCVDLICNTLNRQCSCCAE